MEFKISMVRVEIRPSEAAKVPKYTEDLKRVCQRSAEVGLGQALCEWAQQITERRLEWIEQHRDVFRRLRGTEVRKGFQLVLQEYMGIPLQEIPIIEETETKITWGAYDFCPYYEAIKALGMDTRLVCRDATEGPVQAMLNILNPKLRFSRNYERVRPYAEYCEETIELLGD